MADEVWTMERPAPPASEPQAEGAPADARLRAVEAELERTRARLHEADHRAKNTLQVASSLVLLQARRIKASPDPGVLTAIADRINALAIAHRLLAESEADDFDVGAFLREIGADLAGGSERIALAFDVAPAFVGAAKAPPLALLLHEVIANAVRHAFPDDATGAIAVSAARDGDLVRIVVADDGVGVPEGAPEGFGLMLVNLLARQLRAEVTREATQPGTRVSVTLTADGA